MKTVVVLYGGIGDTIMAYEQIKSSKVDIIFANKGASEVLSAANCDIPVFIFNLTVGDTVLAKINNALDIFVLYGRLLTLRPVKVSFISFSFIWKMLPFINSKSFNKQAMHQPRSVAIRELLKR